MEDDQTMNVADESQRSQRSQTKGRKLRRRGKRRRSWKPYYKLTAEERKRLEAYEEKRAERSRALRFKHGFPVAPYNTTQFLFNDRMQNSAINGEKSINVDEIVEHIRCRARTRSDSFESAASAPGGAGHFSTDFSGVSLWASATSAEDDDNDSTADELEQRQFDQAYEWAHNERLESMSKTDLIKDFLELEKQVERIQRELTIKTQELNQLHQQLIVKEAKYSTIGGQQRQ